MQGLARLQHLNELLQPSLARLRLLGVLQSVENRIAVLAVERLKELLCMGTCNQSRLQITRDGDRPLGCVRSLPPAVALCGFHLRLARPRESPLGSQTVDRRTVDLGPLAARAAACEALPPPSLLAGCRLPIDPSITEGSLEGLRV